MGAGLRGGEGVDWGFRVGHGGSGVWLRWGFHLAVVLVDLALGLRSFRSCGTGGLGRGGERDLSKDCGCLRSRYDFGRNTLGTMAGVLKISQ